MRVSARIFVVLFAVFIAVAVMPVAASAAGGDARLTVGVPLFVWHDNHRPGNREWNDGWLNNEGIFAGLSWPVMALGPKTDLRAGVTGGGFDNSIYKNSFFFGGMAEIEHHHTERLALQLGGYAGVLTGYDNEVGPGAAPYIGASYALNDTVELGVREFWLPAKTVAGSDVAPSDAYVTGLTIGTRF